jgi:phage tail sheath protein FI
MPDPIPDNERSRFIMRYAIELYFANGGGPCYIISVGDYDGNVPGITAGPATQTAFKRLEAGLKKLEAEDEPTLIVIPEAVYLSTSDYVALNGAALDQAAKLQDRFVILDVQQTMDNSKTVQQDIEAFRTAGSPANNLKFGAAYYPFLNTTIDYNFAGQEAKVAVTLNRKKQDGTDASPAQEVTNLADTDKIKNILRNEIQAKLAEIPLPLPPSAAIAGVYVQTDASRGVWKAPANVGVSYIVGPSRKIDDNDNAMMNVTDTGKSVNPIRHLTGRGNLVWGARTLDSNNTDWKYISVRRFFNFVEESVKKATYRFVFEPNDANTWVKVRGMIENFLTLQWRAGALQGSKPEQAFYVRVGLGQTMTADDVLNGRMIVEIGMAAVRPAEFIVLRFTQIQPQA